MSANLVFLIVFAFATIGLLGLMTYGLKIGLNRAKITDISFLKAFGLYFLLMLAGNICAEMALLVARIDPSELVRIGIGYVVNLVVACLGIALIYKVRLSRAALGLIPFVVCGFAAVALVFVDRIYVYEAFTIPSNGMAPTLLGEHMEAPCPRCKAPAYSSPVDGRELPPDGWPMICSKEITTVRIADPPKTRSDGDRILACKLLKPKRWDIIVFRYPGDPSVNYAKRLVGLPSEKLEIRGGAIWINGEKVEPPEAIRGIHYSPTVDMRGQAISGPGSGPVQLGADEYFVLGDFVEQSSDSRFWDHGAPGHPPYAVPESYIVGVVINIYWPINRWTSFR